MVSFESLSKWLTEFPDPYFRVLCKLLDFFAVSLSFYVGRLVGNFYLSLGLLIPLYALKCFVFQRKKGLLVHDGEHFSQNGLANKGHKLPTEEITRLFLESQRPTFQWLNGLIRTFWLNYSAYVSFTLTKVIWPQIQSDNTMLENLKFDDFQLGDQTPEFKAIHVFKSNRDLFMDMEIDYDGNARVSVVFDADEFCRVPVTLHNIKLRNVKIRIILKEISSYIPFFRGLQIFLLENPGFDWSYSDAASIINLPGLDNCIKKLLTDHIIRRFVWPNRLSISIGELTGDIKLPESLSFLPVDSWLNDDVHIPRPDGIVSVHVKRAESLRLVCACPGRKLLETCEAPSPYVRVSLGCCHWDTKCVSRTRNPIFYETFEFPVEYHHGRIIEVHVLHDSGCSPKEKPLRPNYDDAAILGKVTEKIGNIQYLKRISSWYNLEVHEGRILLLFRWIPLSSTVKSSSGVLCLFISKVVSPQKLQPIIHISLLRGHCLLEEKETLSPLSKSLVTTINESVLFRLTDMKDNMYLEIRLKLNKSTLSDPKTFSVSNLTQSKLLAKIHVKDMEDMVTLSLSSRIMYDSK